MQLPEGEDDVLVEPVEPAWMPGESDSISPGPVASSEGRTANDPPVEGTTSEDDPIASLEFDERQRADFEGLMYIGALRHSFTWQGHRFDICTLTIGDLLEVSEIVRQWEGTMGESRAYITAMVAASLERVDGKPLYIPIGPADSQITGNFEYIRKHWYSFTVDAVYEKVLALEARVAEILNVMGGTSG